MSTATTFDPNAYLAKDAPSASGFDPDKYLSTSPARAPVSTATGTDHWHNLYAGLDGLDNRINDDQKRAFASLDTNSPQDPKEARAGVINQVYLQSKMPQITPQFIANNLQTVTDSYAEHQFGIKGSGMTQATLYGKISEQMKQAKDLSDATGWPVGSPGNQIDLMMGTTLKQESAKDMGITWESANEPFVKLPSFPEVTGTHIMGWNNPAVLAGVWNSVFKPVLEGVESPLGVATLGVGGALAGAAKAGSAPARVALASMSGLFSGLFIKSAVKGAPETMRVLNDPASTTQQKAEAVGGTFRDSVLGILGAVGVAESLKPGTAKLIEKQSPAQAADTLKTESLAEKNPETAQALSNAAEHFDEVSPETLSRATVTEQPAPALEPAAAATPDLNKATVTSTDSGFVVTDGNGQLIDYAKTAEEARKIADAHDAALPPFLRGGQTSLKNATAELERAGYDLPESTPTQTRVMAASWERAKAVLEKNEKAGEELTKRLVADPNIGLTDDQSALLLRHKVGIENALNAAVEEANSPDTPIEERPAASARATELSGQLTEFLDAVKRRGSEWGREGRWRQAMAKEDFSFATQEQLLKASKGGRPLTEAERTRLVEKIDQMKAKQRQLENHVEQLTKESAGTTSTDKNVVSQFIDKQADAARARIRLRAAGGIMYSGLPLDVLGDYAIIGAQHIKNGAVKFADWSAKMVQEFGDKIEPHLRDIFEEAKNKQVKTQDQISAELGDLKSKMQEAVEGETINAKKRMFTPEQRRQGALAAYKTRLTTQIKELESALETNEKIVAGKPVKLTDAEIESLKATRDELKEKYDLAFKGDITDAQRLAKMDKAADREIEKLETQLRNDEVFPDGEKGKLTTKELQAKRDRIESLREERDHARERLQPAEEPKTQTEKKVAALDRQIAELEKQISTETVFEKGKNKLESPEIEARQKRIEALREQRDFIRDRLQPSPEALSAAERDNVAFKNRTQARILELEQKLAAGDFSPKAKRPPVPLDEKGVRLQQQLERIKQDFSIAREEAAQEAKPGYQKALDATSDLARAGAIGGYHTLGKLAGFSLGKFAEVPAAEALGAILRQIPGIKEIAKKANLESGAEATGLARFYTRAAIDGGRDAWETLTTGKSDLKAEIGNAKENARPVKWYDYISGVLHAAEKSPLLRGDFEMRLTKNTARAIENGADVNDPLVMGALRKEAGDYAQRAILQDKNIVADSINGFMSRLESVNPKTKKLDPNRVALAAFIKTFVTKGVVKTPLNHVAAVYEASPVGLLHGVSDAVRANVQGVRGLTPEEANTIIRLMKVGGVGTAVFVWGAIDATKKPEDRIFGGFYQPGEKRDPNDAKFGRIRVDGHNLIIPAPIASVGNLGSTFWRVWESRLNKKDRQDKSMLTLGLAAIFSTGFSVADQTPVASPIIRAEKSIEGGHPERIAYDMVAGLIPAMVQNIAQDTDPEKSRAPRDLPEAVKATIPVLREEVPATKKH